MAETVELTGFPEELKSAMFAAALRSSDACDYCKAIIDKGEKIYFDDVPPSCRPKLALLGLLTYALNAPE
jgi:hypothetical protein